MTSLYWKSLLSYIKLRFFLLKKKSTKSTNPTFNAKVELRGSPRLGVLSNKIPADWLVDWYNLQHQKKNIQQHVLMSNEQFANPQLYGSVVSGWLNYNPHLVGGFNQPRLKNIRQNGWKSSPMPGMNILEICETTSNKCWWANGYTWYLQIKKLWLVIGWMFLFDDSLFGKAVYHVMWMPSNNGFWHLWSHVRPPWYWSRDNFRTIFLEPSHIPYPGFTALLSRWFAGWNPVGGGACGLTTSFLICSSFKSWTMPSFAPFCSSRNTARSRTCHWNSLLCTHKQSSLTLKNGA